MCIIERIMSAPLSAIIFDVDGVLLDSFEENYETCCAIFAALGLEKPTREFFGAHNHLGILDTIRSVMEIKDEGHECEILAVVNNVDIKYTHEATLLPGALEIVPNLAEVYPLGIVTGRLRSHIFSGALVALKDHFSAVVGYEDTVDHKPHPEPLLRAAKLLSVPPETCVYIGDAPTDVAAAHAAGMRVISFGRARVANADAHTDTFFDLPNLVPRSS